LLGVQIQDVNARIAEELNLPVNQGVLVSQVNEGSAAEESGIQAADVIVGIDDHAVTSVSELQEWVARNRPGKEIKVIFLRNGQKKEAIARLKDYEGNISVTRKEI